MGKELEVEKLKGNSNFHTLSFAMENFLAYKGYSNCLKTGVNDNGVQEVVEKSDDKLAACKGLLVLSIEPNIFTHIKTYKSPLEVVG